MSCTDLATFCGSSASSQPRGLPVSTAQKRHARVHTAPINIMVAVPAFQHSPIFGHLASSHTVLKRCSRTICLTAPNAAPVAKGARSQAGLRGLEAARCACFMPSLMAVKPCGVRYFSPLRVGRCSDILPIIPYLLRLKSVVQLTSQVLPPSGEKACSQCAASAVMFDHTKRTRTVLPRSTSL